MSDPWAAWPGAQQPPTEQGPDDQQPYAQPGQQPYAQPGQQPYVQPGYGGPGYGAPPFGAPGPAMPYGNGYPPAHGFPQGPGTNGLAIASMVLGILWIYWIGSILAVIFGHIALDQIKKTGQSGRGMAIAGLVLGYVGLAVVVVVIVVFALGSAVNSTY